MTAVAAAVGAVAGTVVGRTAVELEDGTIGDACKEVVPVGSVLGISIGLGVKLLWCLLWWLAAAFNFADDRCP